MEVRVQEQALDPWRELAAGRQPLDGSFGGTAIFVGTMRDFNQGQGVERMTLEHYPGMTERYLREVCDEAAGRWELVDSLLVHRVGSVRPGDASSWWPCGRSPVTPHSRPAVSLSMN